MRIRHTIFWCAVALTPSLVFAGVPQDAQQLGAVQAVVDFCSRVDPRHDKQFEQQARRALPNIRDDDLDRARHNPAYQQTYQIVASVLKGLSLQDAARDCAAIL
jgi:hypothetical protein